MQFAVVHARCLCGRAVALTPAHKFQGLPHRLIEASPGEALTQLLCGHFIFPFSRALCALTLHVFPQYRASLLLGWNHCLQTAQRRLGSMGRPQVGQVFGWAMPHG